jgi:hypothetical protein
MMSASHWEIAGAHNVSLAPVGGSLETVRTFSNI